MQSGDQQSLSLEDAVSLISQSVQAGKEIKVIQDK
jgi:hypothetical protein